MIAKPLGHKNYGSIPHLPGSRLGPADHKCHGGQFQIACCKKRDKYDRVIVQEKLDGSNVGVALQDNKIIPVTRAGYMANSSPYLLHHFFHIWALKNQARFRAVLSEGQRVCGEWLQVAHGTKYELPHEPFVAFDIMEKKHSRMPFDSFVKNVSRGEFIMPKVISDGHPISVSSAMEILGERGFHGALENIEGAIWRVERNNLIDKLKGNHGGRQYKVDFLVKYVRKGKVDGKYMHGKTVYNNHT